MAANTMKKAVTDKKALEEGLGNKRAVQPNSRDEEVAGGSSFKKSVSIPVGNCAYTYLDMPSGSSTSAWAANPPAFLDK